MFGVLASLHPRVSNPLVKVLKNVWAGGRDVHVTLPGQNRVSGLLRYDSKRDCLFVDDQLIVNIVQVDNWHDTVNIFCV